MTFLGVLLCITNVFSQTKTDIEKLSLTPKTIRSFPINYKILLPRLEYKLWDEDFDTFYQYLTPALKKTQATMSYTTEGVNTMVVPNSILPHSQLDTSTIIKDPGVLNGVWRVITYRKIRFIDSVDIQTKQYYRSDTLLADNSAHDAFIIFKNNDFQILAKEAGTKEFKKKAASNYAIESRRYLMLYKLFKAGSGVSQIGIDEEGHLIINYPSVIEHVRQNEYISYYAIIEQYILERANQ
jgi:hypothetical protein